jgi:hypothetical protein
MCHSPWGVLTSFSSISFNTNSASNGNRLRNANWITAAHDCWSSREVSTKWKVRLKVQSIIEWGKKFLASEAHWSDFCNRSNFGFLVCCLCFILNCSCTLKCWEPDPQNVFPNRHLVCKLSRQKQIYDWTT